MPSASYSMLPPILPQQSLSPSGALTACMVGLLSSRHPCSSQYLGYCWGSHAECSEYVAVPLRSSGKNPQGRWPEEFEALSSWPAMPSEHGAMHRWHHDKSRCMPLCRLLDSHRWRIRIPFQRLFLVSCFASLAIVYPACMPSPYFRRCSWSTCRDLDIV